MKALSNAKPFQDTDPEIGGTFDILSYSGRQYAADKGHVSYSISLSLSCNHII